MWLATLSWSASILCLNVTFSEKSLPTTYLYSAKRSSSCLLCLFFWSIYVAQTLHWSCFKAEGSFSLPIKKLIGRKQRDSAAQGLLKDWKRKYGRVEEKVWKRKYRLLARRRPQMQVLRWSARSFSFYSPLVPPCLPFHSGL
jgi:hypothetical protein